MSYSGEVMDNRSKTLLQINICKRRSQFLFSTVRANASTSAVFILDLLSRKLFITIANAKFHSFIIVFNCINRNISIFKTLESHECLLDVPQQMIKKKKIILVIMIIIMNMIMKLNVF